MGSRLTQAAEVGVASTAKMAAGHGGTDGYFIGVDVGTGSVRAGLFTSKGKGVKYSRKEITTWINSGFTEGSYEQSTSDIWQAVCYTVRDICTGIDPAVVRGVGFDATCSLAVVDAAGDPVTVSPSKDPNRNVILWQDHRAMSEAELINGRGHPVLRFVGGCLSPEMQPPKLLWLKRYLHQECWSKAAHFFDLADYLTYRATGATSRSLCCVVCKWTYVGHHPSPPEDPASLSHGWNESFWRGIGLEDLVDEGFARIGTTILCPGEPVGNGLMENVAKEFGLRPGTPVGTGMVDAHAGGLGTVGADLTELEGVANCPLTSRMALIGGTSTCHMAPTERPIFIPGVWGPYFSAIVPGMFLSEGGQSTAGQLLDHTLQGNTSIYQELVQRAKESNCSVYTQLERVLHELAKQKSLPDVALLTQNLHVSPDFHGNRSPLADPHIQGMICGLSLTDSLEDLAVVYLATLQALAYGTRHIIETMHSHGHQLQVILICGGLRHNGLYIQQHADITGLPLLLTEEEESVLAGSAILGAAAAGDEVSEAMSRMAKVGSGGAVKPCNKEEVVSYHQKKYQVFQELYKDQRKYKTMMQ